MSGSVAEGAVLFDLDGTFADTAPDMGAALNVLLARHGLGPLPLTEIRPHVSSGSRGMLRIGFGLDPRSPDYDSLRRDYLAIYAENIAGETRVFAGIADLVTALEARGLPWGIVTNKPGWLTDPLLERMALPGTPACVVSGDSAARAKPYPDPLLLACDHIGCPAAGCWYIGDDHRDIVAGRAAGMATLAAAYGYLGDELPPSDWGADGIIAHPMEVLDWLERGLPALAAAPQRNPTPRPSA
jgi:phosphoglycolate phosphatase